MKLSFGQFTTSVKAPYTDQTGGWVVPRSNVAEEKNSCICRKSLQCSLQSLYWQSYPGWFY